jgi:hypothetical protein
MKLRMYQVDVETNGQDEIVISQDRRDGGQTAAITISMDQVDFLYSLLQKAREEIERRREGTEDEDEEARPRSVLEQRRR